MRIRKITRWIFSAVSVLVLIFLTANIEKLLAAHGWDAFLLSTPSAPGGWFPNLAVRPSVHLLATAVLGITIGLWLDPLMAAFAAAGRRGVPNGKFSARTP